MPRPRLHLRRSLILGLAVAGACLAVAGRQRSATPEIGGEPDSRGVASAEAGPAGLADCQARGRLLERQLGNRSVPLAAPPFVVSGNLTIERRDGIYREVIQPTCQAQQALYFDRQPSQPIAILLFSDESSYRQAAEHMFFDRDVSRFGYYKPGRRTVLVNLSYGATSLRHELTHTLMAADFPSAPAWLKEGMASMYEAARMDIETNPPRITGGPNWRLPILRRAMATDSLGSLVQLIAKKTLHDADEAINFAHAQGFCLFLQDRELMATCYRRVRDRSQADPTGRKTLDLLLPGFARGNVDREFRLWAKTLDVAPDFQRSSDSRIPH